MKTEQMLDVIRETNLSYLMLAQNMLRADRAQALYRLGINAENARMIEMLTPGQMLRMSSTPLLTCRFRIEDEEIWNLLTGHLKERETRNLHANILMASNFAEAL